MKFISLDYLLQLFGNYFQPLEIVIVGDQVFQSLRSEIYLQLFLYCWWLLVVVNLIVKERLLNVKVQSQLKPRMKRCLDDQLILSSLLLSIDIFQFMEMTIIPKIALSQKIYVCGNIVLVVVWSNTTFKVILLQQMLAIAIGTFSYGLQSKLLNLYVSHHFDLLALGVSQKKA